MYLFQWILNDNDTNIRFFTVTGNFKTDGRGAYPNIRTISIRQVLQRQRSWKCALR